MIQLQNIRITLPNPLHSVPHQSGVFGHLPKGEEVEKLFAALAQAVDDTERVRYRSEISSCLKRMSSAYHPSLPELLSICRSHVELMSDANLEKAAQVCEVAFHGHRAVSDKPDPEVLLTIASYALHFIMVLLRHRLVRHEAAFAELHGRFFHFAHAVLACRQLFENKASKALMQRVVSEIALYLLLERLDLFSMNAAGQNSLIRALASVMPECEVFFIPAGEEIARIDGFWLDQEDKHSPGRSVLHGSLAGSASNDRLATNIMPLIRRLEAQEGKLAGGVQVGFPSEIRELIRRKIKALKRKGERTALHESGHLLCQWEGVVDLPADGGLAVTVLDADALGFSLIIDDRDAELPDVGSLIAVRRSGQRAKRAILIWKRVEPRGVVLGGAWLEANFESVQLSMLGHSEMTVGLREWHALTQRLDDKQVACWIGEPELQPGISILLPVGEKKYSSTLDRVEHRGGNYCRGVLLIGEEWKEIGFELDL